MDRPGRAWRAGQDSRLLNANRESFEKGGRDMAMSEAQYPGWLAQLLTHPVKGPENYVQLLEYLEHAKSAITAYMEVAPLP